MGEYAILGVFALIGAAFAGGAMLVSALLAPTSPDSKHKREPYESGEEAIGSARIQFKVGYYLFALVFLIFDVESVFLFPALSIFRDVADGVLTEIGPFQLWSEILVFVFILGFGLLYAWRKKVLEWE